MNTYLTEKLMIMGKVIIKIRLLGGIKYDIETKKILNWSTNFFKIDENIEILETIPNSTTEENDRYYYSDLQLREILGKTSKEYLTVVIINHKLQRDFYERSIGDNCYVLSLFETGDIVLKNDFKIWQFIIQELYYFSAVFYRTKGEIPLSDEAFTHQAIRKCLFDFNDDKNDIVYSLGNVSICSDCEAQFDKTFVPKDFVKNIKRELRRIKKGIFFRTRDYVRRRPIMSLIIGLLLAIFIGILSNTIFYWLLKAFCKE